jgi:TonB family protein
MDGKGNAITGALVLLVGLGVTIGTAASAGPGGSVTVAYGAIIFGFVQLLIGISQMSGGSEDQETTASAYAVSQSATDALTANARLVSGSISESDYPPAAIRDEAEGSAVVAFTVNRAGDVQDVELVVSSGHSALDRASCDLILDRFKFEPALGASGNPVAQRRQQRIRWQLPQD